MTIKLFFFFFFNFAAALDKLSQLRKHSALIASRYVARRQKLISATSALLKTNLKVFSPSSLRLIPGGTFTTFPSAASCLERRSEAGSVNPPWRKSVFHVISLCGRSTWAANVPPVGF